MRRVLCGALLALGASACVDWSGALDAGCHNANLCGVSGGDSGSDASVSDAGPKADAGASDAGLADAGLTDGGPTDGGQDGGVDGGLQCVPQCTADGGLPPHVVPACINGVCGTACAPLWGDCNQDAGDGCELDLSGDTANCGACNHTCGNANTVSSLCTNGICTFQCSPGYSTCGGSDSLGCAVNLQGDSNNCGVCGYACGGSIPCVQGGVCQLTAGGESIANGDYSGYNSIVADSNSLYWVNSQPQAVRTVNKNDGGGLRTLYTNADVSNSPGLAAGLALDDSFVYMHGGGEPFFYKANKLTHQTPTQLGTPTSGYAGPNSLYVDADTNATAQAVVWTETPNGRGVWQYNFADAGLSYVDNEGVNDILTSSRFGSKLYWVNNLGTLKSYDMAVGPSSLKTLLAMVPTSQLVAGVASDGTYVYVMGRDTNLYRVDGVGNTKTLATACGGATGAVLATDGVNVYIANNDLYKSPIDSTGLPPCTKYIDHTWLPTGQYYIDNSMVLDGNSVYFGTQTDVFKAHK